LRSAPPASAPLIVVLELFGEVANGDEAFTRPLCQLRNSRSVSFVD